MSTYKYLDDNGLIYYHSKVKALLNNKVDKVSGKGLSTNDYTTTEKNKLSGIASGAQVNVIETVKVNGTALTPTNKAVDVSVPIVDTALSTTSTNTIQNKIVKTALDAKAALASPTLTGTPKAPTATAGTNTTQIATTAFVKTAVDNAIAGVTGISFEIVQTLPQTGATGTIYLVPNSGTGQNIYDEYIWIASSSKFEKIGTTDVDLSGYVQDSDMVAITNAEIDTIVA